MLYKLSQDAHLYEDLSEDPLAQDPVESIKKFNKLILQSSVDTCTEHSLFGLRARHEKKLDEDWQSIKRKIVESRGMDYFTVPSPKRAKTANESIPVYVSAYNLIVTNHFHAKVEGRSSGFIQEFMQMEMNRREIDRDNLHNVWKIVQTQVEGLRDEEESFVENIVFATCGFFEKLYLERIIGSTRAEVLMSKVNEFVAGFVKNFANYKPETDKSGLPIWCMLFTLMRSGLKQEFLQYSSANSASREFTKFFSEYVNNTELSEHSLYEVLDFLKTGESLDVFHKALLHIITKSNEDIDEIQENSLEDYLWFKLKLVCHLDAGTIEHLENTRDYFALLLQDLQKYIIDCGPTHFHNSVSLYITALVSSLCYGEAVQYLYEIPEYSTEALHLALVLKEFRLLPSFSNSDKIFDEIEGIVHVNLSKMISIYIKAFSNVSPNEALMYISFMTSGKSIANEASSLVIAYENYQIVLNSEVYIFQTSFRKAVGDNNFKLTVETIAEYALHQRSPEAAYLFDLIENYSCVMKVWITEIKFEVQKLAEKWKNELTRVYSFTEERGKCDMVNYAVQNYSKLYDKYKRADVFVRYSELDLTICVLNGFLTFFEALNKRQFRHALSVLAGLQVLPIRPGRVQDCYSKFKKISNEGKEEYPRVISAAMELCQMVLYRNAAQETPDLKGDIKNLAEFFNELQDGAKGIQDVDSKFKQYAMGVREIASNLSIS